MVDHSFVENLLLIPERKQASKRAKQSVEDLMEIADQKERTSFGANLQDPESSQINFDLFLTTNVLRVAFKKEGETEEKYAWLAVVKENKNNFVFVVETGGKPYSEKTLRKTSFNLRSAGSAETVLVSQVAEKFLKPKGSGPLTTLKVDVMEGGLGPGKSREVPEFGKPTLTPLPNEKTNEN
jgi:hypothetical protein